MILSGGGRATIQLKNVNMCGFLGEVSNNLLNSNDFKVLLDLSKQRGPDQQGVWKDANCQLGFNRLAIIDLTKKAKQPLISPSGRYAMVFNGEIYNYKSLQQKYGITDFKLRSNSDSEILSHLLDVLTIEELIKELNGMFAIAIWDLKLMQLCLIRDFAGIKPLFYGLHSNGIVCASQFDQLFNHPAFALRKLRPEIMKEFFGLGYMSAPNTVFENIFQIEPGQFLIWDLNTKRVIKKEFYYNWSIRPELPDDALSTSILFSKTMAQAVKLQLEADVPVASFLSSGYDSTLVTSYAKQEKTNFTAFTFGLKAHEAYDESQDAKLNAEKLGVSHIIKYGTEKELLAIVDTHFRSIPEPFGDYSSIPTYLITQKAKEHASVMLSGDGGDELFWGYPRFRKSLNQAHWFRYPLWLRKLIIPIIRKKQNYLSSALNNLRFFSDWILSKQVHFNRLDRLVIGVTFSKELQAIYKEPKDLTRASVLQFLKKNEFYGHLQRTLKKVDLTSMAHGLEVRVPFLDKNMIAFSNSVIPQLTITHDHPKLILKTDLSRLLPINNVSKAKKGFSVPIQLWLNNELKEDFINTVLNCPFYGEEHIDSSYLKSIVSNYFEGEKNVDLWGMWHLYAWQKWAIHHNLQVEDKEL